MVVLNEKRQLVEEADAPHPELSQGFSEHLSYHRNGLQPTDVPEKLFSGSFLVMETHMILKNCPEL